MIDEMTKDSFVSKTSQRIKNIVSENTALYLLFIVTFAIIGFAFLLSFPMMAVICAYKLINLVAEFSNPEFTNPEYIPTIAALYTGLVVGLLTSYRIAKIRVCKPSGIKILENKAPELFKLIDHLNSIGSRTNFDRIILTEEHKIEIISTPVFGLPVWNKNTLVIGLPVMINMSPKQFKAALLRKLYQPPRVNLSITYWVVRLRQNWCQYNEAYNKKTKLLDTPLSLFFKYFAPLFERASAIAVRMNELNADSHALRELNDEELLDMIQGEFVCKFFLENAYWPKVRSFVRKSPDISVHPHEKMAQLLKQGLPKKDAMQLLTSAFTTQDSTNDPTPSLRTRLDNIGHRRIKMPTQVKQNAAQAYLQDSFTAYVKIIDKSWMSTTLTQWKKQDKIDKHDTDLLRYLELKATDTKLSYKEIWQFSRLNKKRYGKKAALNFKNILLKKLPQAA